MQDERGRFELIPDQLSFGEMVDHHQPLLSDLRTLTGTSYPSGYKLEFEWGFSPEHSYVIWRWSIQNLRQTTAILHDATMLRCSPEATHPGLTQIGNIDSNGIGDCAFSFPGRENALLLFIPGWQSWSFSGWIRAGEPCPSSKLRPFIHPMVYDRSLRPPKSSGHYRSEMFSAIVDRESRTGICFGFLSQREAFGSCRLIIKKDRREISIHTDLDDVQLAPGESFTSDWACVLTDGSGLEVVDEFVTLAGAVNKARIPSQAPMGWCSWYDYGQAISENIIESNLLAASNMRSQIPMDFIQIDDGFQSAIGDWTTEGQNFPSGMKAIADKIKAQTFRAGIWLAPFIALRDSRVVQDHPGWVLRDRSGSPVNTGLVWNQFGRALDLSHPGFLASLREVISTATTAWGFDYLKLDFLYAGALAGERFNKQITRAQAFRRGLELIRETAAENTTLVGCGCPLGPGIGIFESMRIGPDIRPGWKPSFSLLTPILQNEPTMPAAINAIRNTIARAHLHRNWWINDPDCVLVREANSQLSLQEIQTSLTAVGLSGGSVVLSDALDSLSPERLELFAMLTPALLGHMQLLPLGDVQVHPIVVLEQQSRFDHWWLLACFNLGDRPHEFNLPLQEILSLIGRVHIFDVWNQRYIEEKIGQPLVTRVGGHHTALFAIRQKTNHPSWIGDNVHLSQGKVVQEWQVDEDRIYCEINAKRTCNMRAHLYIKGEVSSAHFNGSSISMKSEQNGIVVLELDSIEAGLLELHHSSVDNDY